MLGAPEFILRSQYQEYAPGIESWSRQGYRVLVFARYKGTLDGKPLTEPVEPMGMILLANPVRDNAKETFHYFAQQGVEIKVISGDNPVTVSQVAAEAESLMPSCMWTPRLWLMRKSLRTRRDPIPFSEG